MAENNAGNVQAEDSFETESGNILQDEEEKENQAGLEVILQETGVFFSYVGGRFSSDRCLRMAAGLSYTSLLAIVPLTAIAFSMLAAFPVFSGVRDVLQDAVFSNLLPQTADATKDYFNQFIQNTTTLSAVGIVALAATAVLLLGTIEADMNAIFRVVRPRALVPRLLVFWALLTLGPLLLGASFSLSTYFFCSHTMGRDRHQWWPDRFLWHIPANYHDHSDVDRVLCHHSQSPRQLNRRHLRCADRGDWFYYPQEDIQLVHRHVPDLSEYLWRNVRHTNFPDLDVSIIVARAGRCHPDRQHQRMAVSGWKATPRPGERGHPPYHRCSGSGHSLQGQPRWRWCCTSKSHPSPNRRWGRSRRCYPLSITRRELCRTHLSQPLDFGPRFRDSNLVRSVSRPRPWLYRQPHAAR